MSAVRALRQAVAFLTPVGGAATPTPGALIWFSTVGAGAGAVVGAVWWGAAQVLPLPVAAAAALAADAAVTGLLHLDGLADAADGLLPPLPAERRLAVMRDVHTGAFGVVAVVVVLLARAGVLGSVTPEPRTILAVAAVWSASRAAMAVAAVTVPYVHPGGLATALMGASPAGRVPGVLAAGVVPPVVLGALGTTSPAQGLLAVVATVVGAAAVVAFAQGRIGGFTGDVLGAAGVVGETMGLVLLAVRR